MKKIIYLTVLLSVAFIQSGCEKTKRGALETMELWSSGNAYYNAKHIDESDFDGVDGSIYADPKNSPNNYVNYYHYYHSDMSPRKLGYTEGPHTDADGKKMYYDKRGYKNPGTNGVWSDGKKSTSSGASGGSGGGGGGACGSSYQSPTTDAQLDAFCGAAYAYRCLDGKPLSDPSVQSVCDSYNSIKTSNAPPCPYCQ